MIDCAAFLDKDQDSVQPVFVAVLLIKGSGKPPLGKKADKKWGGQADYEAYKKNTSVLVPAGH